MSYSAPENPISLARCIFNLRRWASQTSYGPLGLCADYPLIAVSYEQSAPRKTYPKTGRTKVDDDFGDPDWSFGYAVNLIELVRCTLKWLE